MSQMDVTIVRRFKWLTRPHQFSPQDYQILLGNRDKYSSPIPTVSTPKPTTAVYSKTSPRHSRSTSCSLTKRSQASISFRRSPTTFENPDLGFMTSRDGIQM